MYEWFLKRCQSQRWQIIKYPEGRASEGEAQARVDTRVRPAGAEKKTDKVLVLLSFFLEVEDRESMNY
jgi:hypothetical protein